MITGHVHSLESMGLVDGPGIRTVVFLQGCRLRCSFCHNPDTWQLSGGEVFSAEQLMTKIRRFKPYFLRSGGGVTFSGGEPLLQPAFLLEMLKLLKREGIHTCLDTAGVGEGDYTEILRHTDLILYDIKHIDPALYQSMTGQPICHTQSFLQQAQRLGVPLWIRHVLVPGQTDSPAHLKKLQAFVSTLSHVEKVELLPYHLLGVHKYEAMGLSYPLCGVPAMDQDKAAALQAEFFPASASHNNF